MPEISKSVNCHANASKLEGKTKWRKPLEKSVLGVLLISLLGACSISTPFRSVANTPTRDELGTAIVVVTEATLGGTSEQRAAFWSGVRAVQIMLPSQPGLIGYSLRQELLGSRVWTMTVWRGEEEMRRFAESETHRKAMQMGSQALVNLRFARIQREKNLPAPTWDEAMIALESAGKKY